MKKYIAVLVTAFLSTVIGQTSASTSFFTDQSIESLKSSMFCEKEKEKKTDKKGNDVEDEEPECD